MSARAEAEDRARAVAEAMSWLGTPFRDQGDVKGKDGCVDCAMLLVRVFVDTGLIPPFDPRPYPPQWHLHQGEERFLAIVSRLGTEVARAPIPGDVIVWRVGRCFAHGGIVVPHGDPVEPSFDKLRMRRSPHGGPVEPSFDKLRMRKSPHGEPVEPSFDKLRMRRSLHGEPVEPSFDKFRMRKSPHGELVEPHVLHAYYRTQNVTISPLHDAELAYLQNGSPRPRKVFDLWAKGYG